MRVIHKAKNKINNNTKARILKAKFSDIPDQCQEQMDSLKCISTRQNHKKDLAKLQKSQINLQDNYHFLKRCKLKEL